MARFYDYVRPTALWNKTEELLKEAKGLQKNYRDHIVVLQNRSNSSASEKEIDIHPMIRGYGKLKLSGLMNYVA